MPRNMSFALTKQQFLNRTKSVTRRLGWHTVKPGQVINAVEKSQGLKKGEHVKVLGQIKVLTVRIEQLDAITFEECRREGFPDLLPSEFVEFFCKANNCSPYQMVNVIEFMRID